MGSQDIECTELKRRPLANYHPNLWGDLFISYSPEDEVTSACKEKQLQNLKEQIRKKLTNNNAGGDNTATSQVQLKFVDTVQRLGVAYHFEREMGVVLQRIYDSYPIHCDGMGGDLYSVALLFRLLRQAGYNISCGVFKEFKDEKGDFRKTLMSDVRGMLALYEAAHLGVQGEDILEEALVFTTTHLRSMVAHLDYPLSEQVDHALKRPIRRSLERIEARWYISIYPHETSHDTTLLELAKLDFNLVQSLHKQELCNLYRWWKELDFCTKLHFARDRLVECYFWILGAYFEPEYTRGRRILTKVMAMTSIIDDMYDAYGTHEELQLFTDAIERWDINSIDNLPEYMKVGYVALLDVYKEIEEDLEKDGHQYRLQYAVDAMKKQVRAYFEEAKWFHKSYIPTMEEYMSVAMVSTGYSLLTIMSFVGMGEIVTMEALDWASSDPKIVTSSTIICRLMDDISSHQFEQKRGHVASGVECYIKQYRVSEEVVCDKFREQTANAWKDINEEFLRQPRSSTVPIPLLTRVLNLCRSMDLLHKGEDGHTLVDGYTHVGQVVKNSVTSILIDPIV